MIKLENGFNECKKVINNYLNQIETLLREDTFKKRIEASRQRLDHEKMHLLIVGEFSRGKSTFINAILGQPVLPSKVNPTTAIITTITGGNERKLSINYKDETTFQVDVPDDKVNKFLEEYVTTINNRANEIRETQITWPGELNNWGCIIVDTPGVNDLDEMREEITYNYLSNADACILVLDSQQPLSESERSFLKDKVLQKDINRLLFVINRIDEVEEEPNGETTNRLINYVKKLISETVPVIEQPEIYAVSSKEALRGRYKNTDNMWMKTFDYFQERLVEFISRNATKEKIPSHFHRLIGIIDDGIKMYEEQVNLSNLSNMEVEKEMDRLNLQEKNVQNQLNLFNIFIENELKELSNRVESEAREGFNNLKELLKHNVENCVTESDFLNIKPNLTRGIRQVVERVEDVLKQGKFEVKQKASVSFSDLIDIKGNALVSTNNNAIALRQNSVDEISIDTSIKKDLYMISEEKKDKLLLQGGAAGLGALLFGPVGAIVGMFGASYINRRMDDQRRSVEIVRTMESIIGQLNIIINNVKETSRQLTKNELEPLKSEIVERAMSKIETLNLAISTRRDQLAGKGDELKSEAKKLEMHMEYLKDVKRNVEREVATFYERA